MNKNRIIATALGFLLYALQASLAQAEHTRPPEGPGGAPPIATTAHDAPMAGQYTEEGADTCIKCHDEDADYPVFDIFKTKHGQRADPRAPFAGLQCEACHGPGVAGARAMEEILERGGHVGRVRPGHERPPIFNFGFKSDEPVEEQNQMCLNCHQGNKHIGWAGGTHQSANVACANCHTIHAGRDPVLERRTQPQVCYQCHLNKKSEFHRPSVHPVRFGQMGCSDCHSTHGTVTADLLVKPTLNQTCYTCHAEKRGPFLWEHAPASEDCSLCHQPHGSIHPALLRKRAPLLCQQCHSPMGHPSAAFTAAGLPGNGGASAFMLGNGCMNCHTQVHGSNHPSGVKLMR